MMREVVAVGNALDLPGYPVSAAVAAGDLVFTAGVVAIDSVSGDLLDGDVSAQTHQVLDNLAAILAAAGSSLSDMLFVDVLLREAERDFGAFNVVYSERVVDPPARRTHGAALALPGLLVEISAVAVRRERTAT